MRSIDRKNAIENLEQNIRWIEEIECHQFPGWGNVTMAMRDAAELLKEQEPIESALNCHSAYLYDKFKCGACGARLIYRVNYCSNCGERVKWDETGMDRPEEGNA